MSAKLEDAKTEVMQEKQYLIAKNLLQEHIDLEIVARITKLNIETLIKLREELKLNE
jgi:hypothetical protein